MLAIVALAATVIPILVAQVNDFATRFPGYVKDVTEGRGRLGDFAERYHIVERVREAVQDGGAPRPSGSPVRPSP